MAFENRHGSQEAHTAEYYEQYSSTISSGEARIPICFVIDTSASMNCIIDSPKAIPYGPVRWVDGQQVQSVRSRDGSPLPTRFSELQNVMRQMIQKMKNNPVLARSAVISIITFDMFSDCVLDFLDVEHVNPDIVNTFRLGRERTNAAKGLSMALERLDEFMAMNRNAGNESYRPVLVFLSDGLPTDGEEANRLQEQVRTRSDNQELHVIPVAIGTGIDERWLRSLTRDSRAWRMNSESEFQQIFDEITTRIQQAAVVLSVDETLSVMEETSYMKENENLEDTRYGENRQEDLFASMMDFLNQDDFK